MKSELDGMSVGSGDVTVVEFFDYNCGYCRKTLPDLVKLIENEPNIKVQFMEYPILAPESKDASKVAIAAAKQGKYFEFHKAMFATGPRIEGIRAQGCRAARSRYDAPASRYGFAGDRCADLANCRSRQADVHRWYAILHHWRQSEPRLDPIRSVEGTWLPRPARTGARLAPRRAV